MPWAPTKHCPHGHPPYTGNRCPICASTARARADAVRPSASERGYSSKWRQAREGFLKANPTCAICNAPATVVDHIAPHKGNKQLFWDRSNWQQICAPCHNRKTATHDGGFGRQPTPGGIVYSSGDASGPLGTTQTQSNGNWEFWT